MNHKYTTIIEVLISTNAPDRDEAISRFIEAEATLKGTLRKFETLFGTGVSFVEMKRLDPAPAVEIKKSAYTVVAP